MRKKIYIGTSILILLIGIAIPLYLYNVKNNKNLNNPKENQNEVNKSPNHSSEQNKITNDQRYLTISENGIIKDKENGNIIYNPTETYSEPTLSKIEISNLLENKEEMYEYLKFFFWAFPKQTYDSFSLNEIAIIVSLTLNTFEPNSNDYVKKIAKRYFGITNYELPTGTYEISNYGNYTIIKENNYYIRSSIEKSTTSDLENTSHELTNINRNGNKLIVYYDYMKGNLMNGTCYSENESFEEREKCKIGSYIVTLTYDSKEDTLIVEKMEYRKK